MFSFLSRKERDLKRQQTENDKISAQLRDAADHGRYDDVVQVLNAHVNHTQEPVSKMTM